MPISTEKALEHANCFKLAIPNLYIGFARKKGLLKKYPPTRNLSRILSDLETSARRLVKGSPCDFILGWKDLDLEGGSGVDRDYQDMIISLKVTHPRTDHYAPSRFWVSRSCRV